MRQCKGVISKELGHSEYLCLTPEGPVKPVFLRVRTVYIRYSYISCSQTAYLFGFSLLDRRIANSQVNIACSVRFPVRSLTSHQTLQSNVT